DPGFPDRALSRPDDPRWQSHSSLAAAATSHRTGCRRLSLLSPMPRFRTGKPPEVDPAAGVPYPGAMSFEVEVKYRSVDADRLRSLLIERGAREDPAMDQEDIYLRHPARDFAQTQEALRLRRIGDDNRVTYKGPRFPGPTKTREEIELPFEGGEAPFRDLASLF